MCIRDSSYTVDATDIVIEAVNEGTDTIITSIDYTLPDNVENLTQTGTAAITGVGNALNNVLTANKADSQLFGDAGQDTLIGNDGNDMLYGGTDNDALNGGNGVDALYGDGGNDTLNGGARI